MKLDDKDPFWWTIKEKCSRGMQCCGECSDMNCEDNANPIVKELKERRAADKPTEIEQKEP